MPPVASTGLVTASTGFERGLQVLDRIRADIALLAAALLVTERADPFATGGRDLALPPVAEGDGSVRRIQAENARVGALVRRTN